MWCSGSVRDAAAEDRAKHGRKGKESKEGVGEKETYSSAAESLTAVLPHSAVRVAAARRSSGHAEGSYAGGGRHAAFVWQNMSALVPPLFCHQMIYVKKPTSRIKAFTGQTPRTQIISTAGEDPNVTGGDVSIQWCCEWCKDRSVEQGQGVR